MWLWLYVVNQEKGSHACTGSELLLNGPSHMLIITKYLASAMKSYDSASTRKIPSIHNKRQQLSNPDKQLLTFFPPCRLGYSFLLSEFSFEMHLRVSLDSCGMRKLNTNLCSFTQMLTFKKRGKIVSQSSGKLLFCPLTSFWAGHRLTFLLFLRDKIVVFFAILPYLKNKGCVFSAGCCWIPSLCSALTRLIL